VVVDYKTNVLEDASPEELIERDYSWSVVVQHLEAFHTQLIKKETRV